MVLAPDDEGQGLVLKQRNDDDQNQLWTLIPNVARGSSFAGYSLFNVGKELYAKVVDRDEQVILDTPDTPFNDKNYSWTLRTRERDGREVWEIQAVTKNHNMEVSGGECSENTKVVIRTPASASPNLWEIVELPSHTAKDVAVKVQYTPADGATLASIKHLVDGQATSVFRPLKSNRDRTFTLERVDTAFTFEGITFWGEGIRKKSKVSRNFERNTKNGEARFRLSDTAEVFVKDINVKKDQITFTVNDGGHGIGMISFATTIKVGNRLLTSRDPEIPPEKRDDP